MENAKNNELTDLFGEVISAYTRANAIEDGILVDMTQEPFGAMAQEAGIKWPIAMTATAFSRFVDLTPAAKRALNNIKGRWWDVLTMYRYAVRRAAQSGTELLFEFYCVTDRVKPSLCTLKAVCGPDDNGEPCITFMLPDED